MRFIVLIWIALIVIPLGDFCYSIYWCTLVAQPIFMAAAGVGRIVLAVLILVGAICSSICAYFMFARQHGKLNYSKKSFHGWIVATFVSILLCVAAMVVSSTEGQKVCATRISTFMRTKPDDSRVISFLRSYSTEYSRLRYEYSYGEVTFESFLILTCAWVVVILVFLAMAELK
jgi:hypothetical protein